jgi:hypothetical protein
MVINLFTGSRKRVHFIHCCSAEVSETSEIQNPVTKIGSGGVFDRGCRSFLQSSSLAAQPSGEPKISNSRMRGYFSPSS